MTKILIFLQNNLVEKLTGPVAQSLQDSDIDVIDRSITKEFTLENSNIAWDSYGAIILIGSISMYRFFKASRLSKWIHYDETKFSPSYYNTILGSDSLNSNGEVLLFKDVESYIKLKGPHHVKPNTFEKAFGGSCQDLKSWFRMLGMKIDPNVKCWISPIENIYQEWRIWVIDGCIVEMTLYSDDKHIGVINEPSWDDDVFNHARKFIEKYQPDTCFVMDIAKSDDGYKVIEYNPIHCSGWYGADIKKIVEYWIKYHRERLSALITN